MPARFTSSAPPPFVLAASRAQSWVDVLRAYSKCCGYLHGVYHPTPVELKHGLSYMPDARSTSLFYYGVIKTPITSVTPEKSLVLAVLKRYKDCGSVAALRRVIEEDVNSSTLEGARAKLALASTAALWEAALETLLSHPPLIKSTLQRRVVLSALCKGNQWRLALGVLYMEPKVDLHPIMVRPLVRCFGRLQNHRSALRLTAAALATGSSMNIGLLSALLPTLQGTGKWQLALHAAQELHLLSATRAEARTNLSIYNQLVDCLYEADVYAAFSLDDVVQQTVDRMRPRASEETRMATRAPQFRMHSPVEIFQQFQSVLMALTCVYSKAMCAPRWYSRSISGIVDSALKENTVLIVLDTNVLLHLVQKQLPLEHFYAYMKQLYPDLQQYSFATVVVPFTTVSEAYAYIWGPKEHFPLNVRKLLWSRAVSLLQQPHVYVLSLAGEYPCSSLNIIPRLAYRTMPDNVAGAFHQDPDLRILSVCAALQHYFRIAKVTDNLGGTTIPMGVALFSLLKYHVRRYCKTVKGCCVDRLLLCTLDKRMSRGAVQMGMRVFPCLFP
ncbi:conserved hypothetical protein [Leishmania braziliensis MHOM/BR/75/M2904]|uniref:PIN domain-containing protein n=2 Tax=Leishmania braziliensis TaxID=5660 RepID=A4HL31_LEIBR|nr:conserved hypothetical protein [Leishmania braziliensis MHOM/BR/75/M2904]KAI5687792.1 hypothetical protein MNV84_06859 [Leishmania braziliensis]CAJ2479030.1 unnamed protein product [Leishmania braziliensis]CAJ2479430.1 unnamed protein product [Leishmania braziliensis]CAM43212.1 conserved hypothetical protein [Leishmania braziliensis MHOM/BR/75/M2904]SYZ68929.1 hypothetical_protein [Leishmania braziliensis MHOM/BR/75/M2904]